MRNSFASHLMKLAKEDDSILLITGDLGFGVLDDFRKSIPRQFINSGVAEQSMMSMAAGLASQGYRPFVYSIANFPTFRCLEQIRNDVCYMENPVTIVSIGAGLGYGVHGYSHHAVEDLAVMRALPNLGIYSPSDTSETILSMNLILDSPEPAYLRLGKGGERLLNTEPLDFVRQPNVIRNGSDGVLCWTGGIGAAVVDAANLLETNGVKAMLVSMPFLSDSTLIQLLSIAGDQPILTVEEHAVRGGFGSWLLEIANEQRHSGTIQRVGVSPKFNREIGSQKYLLNKSELSPSGISRRFQEMIG